ncbi:hypothetical protein SYNGFB01_08350 [Synechococcus sp. GFB01]|nr:hypothetical protein SYNGFB01_08350 [Synechococcus sp. GFB01]
MNESPSPSRLDVMQALEDGWQAFRRAPWAFVLFILLVAALCGLFNGIARTGMTEAGEVRGAVGGIAVLVGGIGSTVVSLWGMTGMVRGAWLALDGQRPAFAEFSRWDGRAAGRLFLRQLTLAVVLLLIIVLAVVVGLGLTRLNEALLWVPAAVALLLLAYLTVNQTFLPYVALLEGPGPMATIQRGREMVDPAWGQVLLLLLLEAVLVMAGMLLCFVGLLVAAPVVACTSTAAYRQLFGREDRTGLLG